MILKTTGITTKNNWNETKKMLVWKVWYTSNDINLITKTIGPAILCCDNMTSSGHIKQIIVAGMVI